ncbi:hypothetical protein VYU27_009702, partial [Nannochloropsis oceanica]
MATFPGNSWEQNDPPPCMRPLLQALKAAGDVEQQGREGGSEGGVAGGRDGGREARDAALREVLRHFGAWEFEEKADLQQHWQPVLEILHDSLADTLASCPKLLLVPSPSSSPSSSSSFKRKKEMRARLAVLEAEVLAMKNGEPLPLPANYAQALEHTSLLLRFLALLLRNSINAHVFPSGLLVSALLGARDDELAARAMEVLYLLGLPTPTSLETRTDFPLFLPPSLYGGERHLPRRLVAMAAGWGGKSQGLSLAACLAPSPPSPLPSSGGDFKMEVSLSSSSSSEPSTPPSLVILERKAVHVDPRDSSVIFLEILGEAVRGGSLSSLPATTLFPLLHRLRLARAFSSPNNRARAICVRLQALCTLVHTLGGGNHMPPSSTGGSSQDTARLAGLLQMQPELIHEMVEVARQPPTGSDRVHLEASLLALNTLAALAGSRIGSRHVNVLAQLGVARGQYTGLLPSLFRYAEISLTTGLAAPAPFRPLPTGKEEGEGEGGKEGGERDMDMDVGLAFVRATKEEGGTEGRMEEQEEGRREARREEELLWLDGVMTLLSAVVSVQPGATALVECGLVPALVSIIRATPPPLPTDTAGGGGRGGGRKGRVDDARRNYVVAQAANVLETVVVNSPVGLHAYREVQASSVIIHRLHEEVMRLRKP